MRDLLQNVHFATGPNLLTSMFMISFPDPSSFRYIELYKDYVVLDLMLIL